MRRQPAGGPRKMESLPEVFLNHLYLVLDSGTYTAIERDVFLQQRFAVRETRTTVRADQTYTGLYFYGANTYCEFFDIADSPQRRVGDSGIAFAVEQAGAVETLKKVHRRQFEPEVKLVTRLFRNKQVPWFYMAVSKALPFESGLSSWVMEYHPEFLVNWHPKPKGANRNIRRRDILKRYSEVLDARNDLALEDVTSLTVAADARTRDKLRNFCLQLGCRIAEHQGGTTELHGTDFVLRVVPGAEDIRGIREIGMRTRDLPAGRKELRFGNSVLKFNGRSAIWSFS